MITRAWTEKEIANVLSVYKFPYRRWKLLPNGYWGLNLHYEMDLLVVSSRNYAYEVEIKTTLADLRAEQKKRHDHNCGFTRGLWFAGPMDIQDALMELSPTHAGVIVVERNDHEWRDRFPYSLKTIRKPKLRKINPLTDDFVMKIDRLISLRYWSERNRGSPICENPRV